MEGQGPRASGFWPTHYEPIPGFGACHSSWVAPAPEASDEDSAGVIAVELPGVGESDVALRVGVGVPGLSGE